MTKLEQAARALLAHWDTPAWKYLKPTGDLMADLREALAEQEECKECGAKQAQIDRLMLEYCPDEMTPEQMQEWGNNQRPAEQAEQEPVVFYRCNGCGHAYESFAPSSCDCMEGQDFSRIEYYAYPVRTKDSCHPWQDLTDDEIEKAFWGNGDTEIEGCRAVIAADREKNK